MTPMPICRMLDAHWIDFDFALALPRTGSSMPASNAMMAITTNNSISVNAL